MSTPLLCPEVSRPPPARQSARHNLLLAAMPVSDYELLRPELDLVPLPLGCALYQAGSTQEYLYFPTSGVVSEFFVTEEGSLTGVALTGSEGVMGTALLMGARTTAGHAEVQIPGDAYRLRLGALELRFEHGGTLRDLALPYIQALITQMSLTAVCNHHHTMVQRLGRLLLLCLDRLPSSELPLTQELIANMLGVRREGVTVAVGVLEAAGLIHHKRGYISVPDRSNLELRGCECYSVIRREYERLLPPGWTGRSTHQWNKLPARTAGYRLPSSRTGAIFSKRCRPAHSDGARAASSSTTG